MAVITVVAAAYVGRVLAGCNNTIMTRTTGAYDLGMVNGYGRHKSHGAVAVLADTCRLYVNRTFARRGQAFGA